MSDNYGRGSNPPDSGNQPPYQPPQQPYQQPYQQPAQQPYQPPQQPYQQPPQYQQQPYQQPPQYTPPPVQQSSTVVTSGGGGSPLLPILIGVVVVAILAVGGYFLFFNKSSSNNTNVASATPTAVVSSNNGNGNSNSGNNQANTPTGNSGNNQANTPTDNSSNTPTSNNGNNNNGNSGGLLTGLMVQANGKAADMLLPKETLGYFSFNAKPGGDQQANLQRISDAFTSQAGWAALSQQISGLSKGTTQQSAQQCAGTSTSDNKNGFIANATDIFQGNVMVAFITPGPDKLQALGNLGNSTSEQQSCAVLQLINDGVVVIADTSVSQGDLLGKVKDASGSATKVDSYNGQDITKFTSGTSTYFLTMYGNAAVLAANEDNIKKIVDTDKSGDALGGDAQYQSAVSHLPANRLGSFYLNVTETAALVQSAMPASSSTDTATVQMMNQLANIKGVLLASFTAQPNGLQIDFSSNIDLGQLAGSYVAPKLDPRTFLDKIPADAWLLIGSQDLGGIVNGLVGQVNGIAATTGSDATTTQQQVDSFKQQVNSLTGMDFDKDLVPLLNGEMALYVSPDASGGMLPVGGALVIKTSDAGKAATLAQNIAQQASAAMAASAGSSDTSGLGSDTTPSDSSAPAAGAAPQEQDMDGGKFYALNTGSGTAYVGTIDDLLFISYGKGAIDNWGKSGVSGSDVFKNSTGTTEKPNSGLIYVNIKSIVAFVQQTLFSSADSQQQFNQYKPLFAPFEGMAISNTQYDKNGSHVVVFFDIQKP
jgi:hypothetical protein